MTRFYKGFKIRVRETGDGWIWGVFDANGCQFLRSEDYHFSDKQIDAYKEAKSAVDNYVKRTGY